MIGLMIFQCCCREPNLPPGENSFDDIHAVEKWFPRPVKHIIVDQAGKWRRQKGGMDPSP
jgi:hypothetical protein